MAKKRRAIEVQNSYIEVDSECLRIHGIHNVSLSSESESGKSEFDDEYYKYKPRPININKKQIIIVEKVKNKGDEYKWNYPVQSSFTKTDEDVLPQSGEKVIPTKMKKVKKKCIVNVTPTPLKPSRKENTYAQYLFSNKQLNSEIMSNSKTIKNKQVHRNTTHENSLTENNTIFKTPSTMVSPIYHDYITDGELNFSTEQYEGNNFNISHHMLQPELIEVNINKNDPVRNFLSVRKQTSNYSEISNGNRPTIVDQQTRNTSDISSATQRNGSINENIKDIPPNPNLIAIGIKMKCNRNVPWTPMESSRKKYTTPACSPNTNHLNNEIMCNQSESTDNKQVNRHTTHKNSAIENQVFPSVSSIMYPIYNDFIESQTTNRIQNVSPCTQYGINDLNISPQILTIQPEINFNRSYPVQQILSEGGQTGNYPEITENHSTIIEQQRTYSDISNATQRHIVISENINNTHEESLTGDEVSLMTTDSSSFSCCNVC